LKTAPPRGPRCAPRVRVTAGGEERGKKSLLPIDMRDSRRLTNNERRLTAAGRPDHIIIYEACVFTIIYIIFTRLQCIYTYGRASPFFYFSISKRISFSRLNFSFSYAYIFTRTNCMERVHPTNIASSL